jgi:hypothetical protein
MELIEMSMILFQVNNDLFHVLMARLRQSNGTPIRLFGNGPHVIAYLHANPDTDFLLETVQTGQQLPGTSKAKYRLASGHVFCGRVRFDSAANVVICS